MTEAMDLEREAIEHDRDLAWELYDAQPQHPRIPQLARQVLAQAPQFTGMVILLALHHQALGEADEARRLLQELIGRRDRQYISAVRTLRDLELGEENNVEALRLAEIVLREDPEAGWLDRMEFASATVVVVDPDTGWDLLDEAVTFCGRTRPDEYAHALGQRALRFLASGAPPARFLDAAQLAIEADPSETLLEIALAYAYLYDYRPKEAERIFRRVLREDPMDEVAQAGVIIVRGFLDPLERTDYTMDDLRRAGLGEMAWRTLRDTLFGTGVGEALAALDAVIPAELARALLPPLAPEAAQESGGDAKLLAWHDGQLAGTGALWSGDWPFRLMTSEEIRTMDEAIEHHPEDWPRWDWESEYFTQIFTDDADGFVFEGTAGRLYRRVPDEEDREIAPSLADWLWDRVAAFGGVDRRPGRGARTSTGSGP